MEGGRKEGEAKGGRKEGSGWIYGLMYGEGG